MKGREGYSIYERKERVKYLLKEEKGIVSLKGREGYSIYRKGGRGAVSMKERIG